MLWMILKHLVWNCYVRMKTPRFPQRKRGVAIGSDFRSHQTEKLLHNIPVPVLDAAHLDDVRVAESCKFL